MIWRIYIFIFCNVALCWNLQAHEVRPAYLHIKQAGSDQFKILWKVPTSAGRELSIKPHFPQDFVLKLQSEREFPSSKIYNYTAEFQGKLSGKIITISNLENTLIDVMINIELENDINHSFLLHPDNPEVTIPVEPDRLSVFFGYIRLGVEHILLGYDHLLFVLVLLLLITNVSHLFWTITSFTSAHSITLGLASLQILTLPSAPVEAIIALSILFLAKEYLTVQNGGTSMTASYPWIVSFTFGLLHGFGFAGALSDIGFPQNQILTALLSFNIGVELGQILFIIVCLIVMAVIKKSNLFSNDRLLKKIVTYGIGSIASFWLITRFYGILI